MIPGLTPSSPGRRASDMAPEPWPSPRSDPALQVMLDEEAIGIAFQLQMRVATGEVIGVEALLRLSDDSAPDALFERAAAAGLAERLSRTMLRKALRAAASWEGPLGELRLSLNVLPEDLARDGFERWLLAEIAEAGLPATRITAEITESSLIGDPRAAAARLARLRAAGVRIAIDDFGTGYASLAWLSTLPLDQLKIDRGLILDLVGGRRAQIVVKALIALARELELQVLVEGVEDPAQLALLREWGCDLYQGFLGSPALDASDLETFLAR